MKPTTLALAVVNAGAGRFDENLSTCIRMTRQAAKAGAGLIAFPEMNLTGYAANHDVLSLARPLDSDLTTDLADLSDRLNIAILAGLAEKTSEGRVYASQVLFSPGREPGIYRKVHTAPNEKACFSPGDDVPVFDLGSLRLGVQLCYDAHFPELSTAMAVKEADLILIPHASPRGTPEGKYRSWMRHLSARAFDNGLFVGAVNQTGDNGMGLSFPGLALLIGPDGNVVSKSLASGEHLHLVVLNPDLLERVRSHRMRYFLPYRRNDMFPVKI